MGMRRSTRQELRKLREICREALDGVRCFLCKELILQSDNCYGPGDGEGSPFEVGITIHHADGNHSNNDKKNRKLVHTKCHKSHHLKERHAQRRAEKRMAKSAAAPRLVKGFHGSELALKLKAALDKVKSNGGVKYPARKQKSTKKSGGHHAWAKKIFNATPPGSLHDYLGVPRDKKIPIGKLKWATRQTKTALDKKFAAKAAMTLRFAMKRAAAR